MPEDCGMRRPSGRDEADLSSLHDGRMDVPGKSAQDPSRFESSIDSDSSFLFFKKVNSILHTNEQKHNRRWVRITVLLPSSTIRS